MSEEISPDMIMSGRSALTAEVSALRAAEAEFDGMKQIMKAHINMMDEEE